MNSPSAPDRVDRDDLIIVARAVRTRGLKGELVADVLTDFPERFEKVSTLTAVLRTSSSAVGTENTGFQKRHGFQVRGLRYIEAAKPLIGLEFGYRKPNESSSTKTSFTIGNLKAVSFK